MIFVYNKGQLIPKNKGLEKEELFDTLQYEADVNLEDEANIYRRTFPYSLKEEKALKCRCICNFDEIQQLKRLLVSGGLWASQSMLR